MGLDAFASVVMVTLEGAAADAPLAAAWAQIAGLKPQLASHVDVVLHSYRGEAWYVLADRLTATHFRCTPAVQQFLARLDGEHTVAEAHQACAGPDGEEPPDRLEVLQLLTELQSAQLLLGGMPLDSDALYSRHQLMQKQRWIRRLASPLALQIPLLDPDKFLQRMLPWIRPFFSPLFLYLWLLLVALTALAAINQWSALYLHWESRFLDPSNLLSLWLLYPLVKGLHELGHGFATRVWGGEVHEMGVMLLVFTPVPYVDASASSAFQSRHQRMVVAGAGIMVELMLSAMALLIWSYASPGLLRDLCFNILVIGGVSTVLFNGNPLLRFDGYYVLADYLEIPNLRARANAYLGYLLKHHLLHLQTTTAVPDSPRERAWLLGFAILAGIYRLLIGFTIALFIAGKYFFVGISLALWLIISQMCLPLYRLYARLLKQARGEAGLLRLCAISAGALVLSFLVLFVIPVSDSTHAEGIVKLAENAQIRVRADGFVEKIFKHNGQLVRAGEPLLQVQNLELQAREVALLAQSKELQIRHSRALSGERIELEFLKAEIATLQREIDEVQEQVANLVVSSPHAGVFALLRARDLAGRFVHKGDLVGHVLDHSAPTVRVVVSQAAVDRVLHNTRAIEVRLASNVVETLQAQRLQEVPLATTELPSALLGSLEGGDIAVDARDRGGRLAITNVFQLDISLPQSSANTYLGQRAFVRFVHDREPLGTGWYRQLRQLLLARIEL
jgi:putative peptide zinc metalloprotease protein